MHNRTQLCAIALATAALLAVFVSHGVIQAQQEAAPAEGMAVGTYQPQQIAEQIGLQDEMQRTIQGLQERLNAAQQQGDQAAMQQIQVEAQQVQQDIVSKFERDLNAAMPAVAEETGVQIIAVDVAYTAPDIRTQDVTGPLVEKLRPDNASEPGLLLPPQ